MQSVEQSCTILLAPKLSKRPAFSRIATLKCVTVSPPPPYAPPPPRTVPFLDAFPLTMWMYKEEESEVPAEPQNAKMHLLVRKIWDSIHKRKVIKNLVTFKALYVFERFYTINE